MFFSPAHSVIFEGVPTYPDCARFWQIIEKYHVSLFYTAPTAIRMLMKLGEAPLAGRDLLALASGGGQQACVLAAAGASALGWGLAQQVFDLLGGQDKTMKVYPGLFHEILNEVERETVLRDLTDWLGTH